MLVLGWLQVFDSLRLWVWPESVGALRTVKAEQDQQREPAQNWNKDQKIPPSAAICVMQSTDGDGKCWDKNTEREYDVKQADTVLIVIGTNHHIENRYDNSGNHKTKIIQPEFFTAGAA